MFIHRRKAFKSGQHSGPGVSVFERVSGGSSARVARAERTENFRVYLERIQRTEVPVFTVVRNYLFARIGAAY